MSLLLFSVALPLLLLLLPPLTLFLSCYIAYRVRSSLYFLFPSHLPPSLLIPHYLRTRGCRNLKFPLFFLFFFFLLGAPSWVVPALPPLFFYFAREFPRIEIRDGGKKRGRRKNDCCYLTDIRGSSSKKVRQLDPATFVYWLRCLKTTLELFHTTSRWIDFYCYFCRLVAPCVLEAKKKKKKTSQTRKYHWEKKICIHIWSE